MSMHGALRKHRADLENEWARLVPGPRTPQSLPVAGTALRPEVTESWMRSLGRVDPATDSAPVTDGGRVGPGWPGSPLRNAVGRVAGELRSIADDAGFVAAVTDETGTIQWTCGGRVMRRRAERVNFAPGGRWDEGAMGTNALSLALLTGRPSSVFSAEHLVAALHGWVCYCAPVRGPGGRILGVLDLSTTWDRSHPLAMSTVRSVVSTMEAALRENGGASPQAGLPLLVRCLGREEVISDGSMLHLPPRQQEILTLLALNPEGLGSEQLRWALYGERPVSSSTFKAEVSHLRRALGGAITPRRYTLTAAVDCDAVEVLRALGRGDTTTAVRLYRGPLLPRSQAPGIAEWREQLAVGVREAVLASSRAEHALRLGEHAPFDTEIHEHALRLLGPEDVRRAVAAGRLSTALHD
ncbi:helix-turn-helix domain-containing protein [Streptomyces meridianus]|uniref:Transcriptional regulator n=1 Tax=Streptomyces meridianus TaxID=2938945 RepID=A0ABT0XAL6_9ACTN|nr:helix-turn-helix domain-containing protein [Streptomyces meridianus]MCM2578958.1 transcriptional regulator [Streptomyces meridianus]